MAKSHHAKKSHKKHGGKKAHKKHSTGKKVHKKHRAVKALGHRPQTPRQREWQAAVQNERNNGLSFKDALIRAAAKRGKKHHGPARAHKRPKKRGSASKGKHLQAMDDFGSSGDSSQASSL